MADFKKQDYFFLPHIEKLVPNPGPNIQIFKKILIVHVINFDKIINFINFDKMLAVEMSFRKIQK